MTISNFQIPELDRKGLREFGLVTGFIVAGLFGLFIPWVFERPQATWPTWPWIFLAIIGVWALVAPMSLRPVYHLWMRFGLLMSRFTTPIIMALVFFLIITPVALLLKIIGRDAMARKPNNSSTYRVPSHKAPVDNLKRPF
jgi:hypothetical protein